MDRAARFIFFLSIFNLAPGTGWAIDYAIDAHTGTMGEGFGLTLDMAPKFGVRLGVNPSGSADYEHTIDDDEGLIFSTPKINFDNKYLFLDSKPFWGETTGGFYITIGAVFNDNSVHTTSLVETGGQRIGNANAPVGTRLNGTLRYSDSGYLGGRYDFGKDGFFGRPDFGFVVLAAPKVELDVIDPAGTIAEQDIELERQDLAEEFEVDGLLDMFDFDLNMSLGIGYRF